MGRLWFPNCFFRGVLLVFVAADRKNIWKRKPKHFVDYFGVLHSSFCVLVALFL